MFYVHYIHLQSWPVLCTTYKYMIKQMHRGYLQEPNNSLYTSKNENIKKKRKESPLLPMLMELIRIMGAPAGAHTSRASLQGCNAETTGMSCWEPPRLHPSSGQSRHQDTGSAPHTRGVRLLPDAFTSFSPLLASMGSVQRSVTAQPPAASFTGHHVLLEHPKTAEDRPCRAAPLPPRAQQCFPAH